MQQENLTLQVDLEQTMVLGRVWGADHGCCARCGGTDHRVLGTVWGNRSWGAGQGVGEQTTGCWERCGEETTAGKITGEQREPGLPQTQGWDCQLSSAHFTEQLAESSVSHSCFT